MAYSRLKENKDGSKYYEITISRGRGQGRVYKRWPVPDGLSEKTIQNKLNKYIAELENGIEDGKIMMLREQKALEKAVERERDAMPTLREYAAEFLKAKSSECSANTLQYYRFMLDGHILNVLGDCKIDAIKPTQIKKLLTDMQSNHFSYSTVRGAFVTLRMLLESACVDEIIDRNPCKKEFAPKKAKDITEEQQAYSIQELQRLRECMKEESLKWQVIINLLIETGIRRAELSALRWGCINWDNQAILIDANIIEIKVSGKYELKQVSTKSGKTRVVYVSIDTLDLLKQYADETGAIDNKAYIFVQKDGKTPITPHAITRYCSRIGKKYGFENLHPHLLRHSFATVGILNNADVVSMSKLLGHSDPSITLRVYSHANEEANKQASMQTLKALKGNNTTD